jgi:hypothetical protein
VKLPCISAQRSDLFSGAGSATRFRAHARDIRTRVSESDCDGLAETTARTGYERARAFNRKT